MISRGFKVGEDWAGRLYSILRIGYMMFADARVAAMRAVMKVREGRCLDVEVDDDDQAREDAGLS